MANILSGEFGSVTDSAGPVKSRSRLTDRAQKVLLTTLIWNVQWQGQEEPFRIPTPFCFPPQTRGIYSVRGP